MLMVAKKNFHQVSFLHVYHHATTFFPVWWANVKYGPGGDAYFCCFLNSFIHVLMYGYYFFAAIGIKTPLKYIITQLQMLQFCAFIFQSIYLLFVTDCYRPRISPLFLGIQCAVFLALFMNYYVQTHWKKNKKVKTTSGKVE